MKSKGFTLAEILVALIVLIFGFGVFISIQSFLVNQTLSFSEEVEASRVALDIFNLTDVAPWIVKDFKGSLKDFYKKFNIPENLLSGLNSELIQISLRGHDYESVIQQKKVQFKYLNLTITMPSGFTKEYSVFIRND